MISRLIGSSERLRQWLCTLLCAIGLAASTAARADLVPVDGGSFHDAVYVSGSDLRLTDFRSSTAGTVTIRLSDIAWPEVLQSVSVTLSKLGETLLTRLSPGTISFDIGKDETYSLGVYAMAGGTRKYGMYTLDTTFVPLQVQQVPLPAAGWLLVSGLALARSLRRRQSRGSLPR